jgi:membrane-bound lytic murein transglycosylase MltF
MPRIRTWRVVLSVTAVVLLLATCGGEGDQPTLYGDEALEDFADPDLAPFTGDLDGMRERRLIRALVTPSRTDFFVDSGRIRGVQAEFLREFAKRLNRGVRNEAERIRIKFVPVPFNQLLPALCAGRGDIAAAFLTVTEGRSARVAFAAPFRRSVSEVIVTHSGIDAPDRLEDLAGKRVYVLKGSSYVEHLRELDARLRQKGLDPIEIEEADPRLRSEDILELLNAGVVEMTAVDDYKALLWQRVLPEIEVHESVRLAEGTRVAWAVRPGSPELRAAISAFARDAREGALLGNILIERYFEDVKWIKDPNSRSDRDKLRRYLGLFRKYGQQYGFDPLAVAAQAYQESGLNQDKRSPAGAVGLMQVLPSTAADPRIDVTDIDEPDGNVHAGTKYLAFLRDRYFGDPDILEWDRRALTWAAYNAGPAKIRKARARAKRLGLDSNVWFGNVEVAAAQVISREPVRYVANIHRYYVAYRLSWVDNARRREAAREIE